jgi:hypothetical protein
MIREFIRLLRNLDEALVRGWYQALLPRRKSECCFKKQKKKKKTTSAGEEVEKREGLCTVGGKANWYNYEK